MRRVLGGLWTRWKVTATHIGDFQARMLLTVFYFTVAVPFGLLAQLIDPLHVRRVSETTGWRHRDPDGAALEAARRQF